MKSDMNKLSDLSLKERAELEAYKIKADKRADKQIRKKNKGKRSERKIYSVVMFAFAVCFIVLFVLSLVFELGSEAAIITAVFTIICLITGAIALNITDKEFSEATTKAESVVYLQYDNEAIVCPHCGSQEILLKEKKFSKSKAFLGMTFLGTKGVICGIPNRKRVKCHCAKCGHDFEAVRRQ